MVLKNFEVEINSKHQLLDLNADMVNFDLNFKVTSEIENDEFEALVLPKTELDKYNDLNLIEMKTAPGFIKGNITVNDNIYQNYFLILKKQEGNSKANVQIEIEELENSTHTENNNNTEEGNAQEEGHENSIFSFYHDYFYHILFGLVVALVGYFYFNSKLFKGVRKLQNVVDESSSLTKTPVIEQLPQVTQSEPQLVIPETTTTVSPQIELNSTSIPPKIETYLDSINNNP